jgi:hypothetical protein
VATLAATGLELIADRHGAGPMGRGREPTGPDRARIGRQSAEPAGRARALTPALRVSVLPAVAVRATLLHLERLDAAATPDSGVRRTAMRPGPSERSGRDPSLVVSYGVVPRAAVRLAAVRVGVALRSGQASRRAIRPNRPCPRMLMYGCSTRRCVLS